MGDVRSEEKSESSNSSGHVSGETKSSVKSSGIPIAVEEERRHTIEASVVRTMKARRTLSHFDLVTEVTHQVFYLF